MLDIQTNTLLAIPPDMYGYLVLACLGFASFDVWWFARLWYTRLAARVRKPLKVTSEAVIKSICWTTDIDYFAHMNNAKYLKELDFARYMYTNNLLRSISKQI